jgi:hypothetical protein
MLTEEEIQGGGTAKSSREISAVLFSYHGALLHLLK